MNQRLPMAVLLLAVTLSLGCRYHDPYCYPVNYGCAPAASYPAPTVYSAPAQNCCPPAAPGTNYQVAPSQPTTNVVPAPTGRGATFRTLEPMGSGVR